MDCCVPTPVQLRLSRLRRLLKQKQLEAILLNNKKNIYYYSAFSGDDSLLLVTHSDAYLISDGRFIAQAAAEAPEARFICRPIGTDTFRLAAELCREQQLPSLGFEDTELSYADWRRLQAHLEGANIRLVEAAGLPLTPRLRKDKPEQLCLQKCGELQDKALADILPLLKPGISEQELAWALEQALHTHGAQGLSFPTIVAAGENSAKPHAIPSAYRLQRGDFVTIDFGALYQGYCGDCTRTFAIGAPSPEQKAAYELVLAAQEQALAQIKPGMSCGQADKIARDIIAGGGLGEYFSHSLGHGTGLDIHEAPTLRPGSEAILEPGQVVTVEPGVYLPGRFGLRIEDSCLVTESGLLPLSHFPKELQIL